MSQQDTYRKHPRPTAFNDVRDVVVRKLLDLIGKADITANGIKTRTGLDFDKQQLNRLREGDLGSFSDNRLILLYERLGGRITLTVH